MTNQESNQSSSGNTGDFLEDVTLDQRNYLPEPFHKRAKNAVREAIGDAKDRRLLRQFNRMSRQMRVLEEMDRDGVSSSEKPRRERIAVPAALAVASFSDTPENIDENLDIHSGPPQGGLAPNPADEVIFVNALSQNQGSLPTDGMKP